MGFYLNPTDQAKEVWLEEHARAVSTSTPSLDATPPTEEPGHWICLVNNPGFTAAGIAYSRDEFEAFAHPDGRSKV